MGATTVEGSFSSSNWEQTINQLQDEERRYYRDENGNMVEDTDYAIYSGTILSIDSWNLIKMHNSSEEEILAEIWDEEDDEDDWGEYKYFDKWEGVVAEGPLVGYDLYTPTFNTLSSLPFNYKQYIDIKKGEYALLEYVKNRVGEGEIRVLKQGDLKSCQEEAGWKLGIYTDKVYVICGNRGRHYKCFNTVKRVKNTTRKDECGKLKIKEVHNYYYAGMAAM